MVSYVSWSMSGTLRHRHTGTKTRDGIEIGSPNFSPALKVSVEDGPVSRFRILMRTSVCPPRVARDSTFQTMIGRVVELEEHLALEFSIASIQAGHHLLAIFEHRPPPSRSYLHYLTHHFYTRVTRSLN